MFSFFLSIYLVYSVSLKIFDDKKFTLFCVAFYSLSYYVIFYSSEVKQYMSDVVFCWTITLYTILQTEEDNQSKAWIYALIGAISIWFSNASIIFLFTSGLYFAYKTYRRNPRGYLKIIGVIGSWVISFTVYYLLFIHNHPTKDVMVEYWSYWEAFLPTDILSVEFVGALGRKAVTFFSLLGYSWLSVVFAPVFIIGLYCLGKTKIELLFLITAPIAVHLVLSYFKMYPFSERLILYLYPSLIIALTYGCYYLSTLVKHPSRPLVLYSLIFPLILNLILLYARGFPIEVEEIKKPLSYLDENIGKEDYLYIYYAANNAFTFYERRYSNIIEPHNRNIIRSDNHRDDWSRYEEDVPQTDGTVWILFSHVDWGKDQEEMNEEKYILSLFEKNGYNITGRKKYKGASLYKASSF